MEMPGYRHMGEGIEIHEPRHSGSGLGSVIAAAVGGLDGVPASALVCVGIC